MTPSITELQSWEGLGDYPNQPLSDFTNGHTEAQSGEETWLPPAAVSWQNLDQNPGTLPPIRVLIAWH